MIYLFFFINRILRKEEFDAVLAMNLTTNGLFAARIKKKTKKICSTLGCDLHIPKWNNTQILNNNKFVYRYADRKLDYIITGEEKFYYDFFNNKNLFKRPEKIIRFKGLGIDSELFNTLHKSSKLKKKLYGLEPSDILAVCFRQPRPTLAFPLILNLLPEIIRKYPNFYFAIGTGGREFPDLIEIVKKKNIENNILFMPNVAFDKLHLYLAQADIFIDPVNIKRNPEIIGFGISGATLESMACELIPVIGRRPGLETYFKDDLEQLIYEDMENDLIDFIEMAIININNKVLKQKIRAVVLADSNWNKNIDKLFTLLY